MRCFTTEENKDTPLDFWKFVTGKDRRELIRKRNKKLQEIEGNLEIDPNSIDLLSQLVELYNLTHQYHKAIDLGNKILKIEEKNKIASNNLFYAYDLVEDFESVLEILKRYLRDFQLEKRPELQIFAYAAAAERVFKKKRKISYLLLNKMPFNRPSEVIDINFNTLFTFSRIGWSERRTEVLEIILEIHPQDLDILTALGYSYLSKKNYSKAKVLLYKALSIDRKNFRTNLLLGSYYQKIDKYREAEEVFIRLLRQNSIEKFLSDKIDRQFNVYTDDEIKAITNYKTALGGLASLYYDTGQYKQAVDNYSKLLSYYGLWKRDSTMLDIYIELGKSYQGLGLKRKALNTFKIALKIDPISVEVLASLGIFYFERSMYYRALKFNAKCLKIDPKYEPALKLQEELSRYYK